MTRLTPSQIRDATWVSGGSIWPYIGLFGLIAYVLFSIGKGGLVIGSVIMLVGFYIFFTSEYGSSVQ